MAYDVVSADPHATGLRLPSHMAITSDSRVLVSEFGGGLVRDITTAGDYRNLSTGLFAQNFVNPSGILQLSNSSIYVADSGAGTVFSIQGSGTDSVNTVVMDGIPHPYGLVQFNGKVYTSFSDNTMVGMVEVIPGTAFDINQVFVRDFPVVLTSEPYPHMIGCGGSWPDEVRGTDLLLGHRGLGAVFNVTAGGSFATLRTSLYAWGFTTPLGLKTDPIDGNLYVVEQTTGAIKYVEPGGGYSRFSRPLMTGFREPSCIRFTPDGTAAYVCDRALGAVYRMSLTHR